MVDAVRGKYSTVPNEVQQVNIIAHIRMTRHRLTSGKVDFTLDKALHLTQKCAHNVGKDNPAADLQHLIEAIHQVLRTSWRERRRMRGRARSQK